MTYEHVPAGLPDPSAGRAEPDDSLLNEPHVGVLHVTTAPGTMAVPIWFRHSHTTGVQVITSRRSRKGKAISDTGRFGLLVNAGYRYVSLEGPVVETRACHYEHDLVLMSVRYLGADGERYAAAWADAVGDDLRVFVMRPEHRFAADATGEFAALGVRPLPAPTSSR
jgi:hypothetical protein